MANRVKEEERIEKLIRGLLKLPENKRCINCNSMGPQYVCTTFWTFVCTTCSGVHREFTHRVKSVSMAKFTADEVSALQAGGNERARQIYLKAWDPQRHSLPEGSNLPKLREFIKHVYVNRKYTGDRSTDPLPLVKLNKQNENYDGKPSADTLGRDSYETPGSSGRPELKYYHDEWRSSPRYARENSRSGGFKRSSIRFEVVDDRFRDDGNARGRKSDPRRTASVEVMPRSQSPVPQKNVNRSMSPVVRPVSNLLGKNVPQLQVTGLAKGNKEKSAHASSNNQKKDSSTIRGGSITDKQAPEDKREESTSLIDFDMDPQPSSYEAIADKQTNKSAPFTSVNPSQGITTLESLLFELDAPSNAAPANELQSVNNNDTSIVLSRHTSAPAGDTSLEQGTLERAASDVTSGADQLINAPVPPTLHSASDQSEVTHGQQLEVIGWDYPAPSSFESGPTAQHYGSHIGTNDNQERSNTWLEQSIQAVTLGARDNSSRNASNAPAETTATGRNEHPTRTELPPDLFSLSYPPVASWKTGQPHPMAFGMHYHPSAYQTAGFPNSNISTNPFDLHLSDSDRSVPDQTEMFPFMASTQGNLPSVPVAGGFLTTPIHGTQLTPHGLYSSVPGAHIGHRPPPPAESPIGPLGIGAAGISSGFDFSSLGSTQPASNKSSAPMSQNSLPSTGGNPFE